MNFTLVRGVPGNLNMLVLSNCTHANETSLHEYTSLLLVHLNMTTVFFCDGDICGKKHFLPYRYFSSVQNWNLCSCVHLSQQSIELWWWQKYFNMNFIYFYYIHVTLNIFNVCGIFYNFTIYLFFFFFSNSYNSFLQWY